MPRNVTKDQSAPSITARPTTRADWVNSSTPEADIDSDTCVPETTAGERMDWHLAVGHLFA